MLEEKARKQTSRHIGKILSMLESVNTNKIIIDQVRKEMWFLHDDILEIVCEDKANENCRQSDR